MVPKTTASSELREILRDGLIRHCRERTIAAMERRGSGEATDNSVRVPSYWAGCSRHVAAATQLALSTGAFSPHERVPFRECVGGGRDRDVIQDRIGERPELRAECHGTPLSHGICLIPAIRRKWECSSSRGEQGIGATGSEAFTPLASGPILDMRRPNSGPRLSRRETGCPIELDC